MLLSGKFRIGSLSTCCKCLCNCNRNKITNNIFVFANKAAANIDISAKTTLDVNLSEAGDDTDAIVPGSLGTEDSTLTIDEDINITRASGTYTIFASALICTSTITNFL